MLSDLVKIEPKYVNERTKILLQEIKNASKYLQSLLTFSCVFFFSVFLPKRLADLLGSDFMI